LQIASNLVNAVVQAASEYEGVKSVEEVHLSIGRLTFVGEEQLRFCWGAVTEERDLLRGSALIITEEPVEVKCSSCGYEGGLDVKEDPLFHYMIPVFACPECSSDVEVVRGKGVTVKNVKLMIDDGTEE
jgi:hydrogenase nickel incorporation protein HypA/HybF